MAAPEPVPPAKTRARARERTAATRLGTVLATLALVVGFLVVAGVVLVRNHLLDDQLYLDTLERADVYERTYAEILADPELADIKERLIGELRLGEIDPSSVRILKTNTLRWALPPSTLRQGTETFITALLAYVRGDTDGIDGDVDLQSVLVELEDVAIREARAALAAAGEVVSSSLAEYRTAVAAFRDSLIEGRVPSAVPSAAESVTQSQLVAVLLEEVDARADVALRTLIEGEAAAGNERDALITALTPLIAGHVDLVQAELRDSLERGRDFDAISQVAERADGSRRRVVAHLDTVRDAASWFGPETLVPGVALMVSGGVVLLVLHRSNPTRVGYVLATAMVLAGVVTLGGWFVVKQGIDSPLNAATRTGEGTWNLPGGLRSVVGDVEDGLAGALDDVVIRLAMIPILAGAALGGGLAIVSMARGMRARHRVAIAAGLALVAAVVTWVVSSPRSPERACNGHVELCDRPYDEVVQAATHNSMSSPDVVEVWPEQDGTIHEQLDDGIRALLVDTHYWTDVVSTEQLTAIDARLPRELASRVVERGGDRLRGREGTFLCHNHCVWGGQPLIDGLVEVRSFLGENPDDVVTLIIQDAITPADTVAVFADSGLESSVYVHEDGAAWPTLGELIDRGERLVVFAENEDPPPAWYHPAFEHIEDTAFGFSEPEEMSCAPNRGPAGAPLFLMNHWVSRVAPDRRTAVVVNAHHFVVERARRCADERGQLPDFVAVDFYSIGDTIDAVDTLNGVG